MASLLVRRAASLPPSFSNQLRQLFSASSLTITHQNASGPIRRMTTNGQSSRPFQVLGLQQIAIGGLDKSPLSNLWTNIFASPRNVDEDTLRLGKEGSPHAVEIDLMMPVDEGKSPKVHIPPLNHIGIWIDNLPAAVEWMEKQGVRFTPGGIRKGASGHDVTFIHPKGNEKSPIGGCGVLIELVQAPKEVIDALS
ncbi:hypothetical protein HJC23_008282 [Cyclotella cryptica]|uniref:VOC domain-containing protein n=1 Tax=Cyclotella cryptica TaxID=29204 RepID=A0ABD3PC00_9STRA